MIEEKIQRSKFIINADDFGISKEVNEGIVYCFVKGLIDRTTIMVNMPELYSAVDLAKKYDFIDKVGLHLNLVEGFPLTEDIKSTILCNKDGSFNNMALKKTKNRLILNKKTECAIKKEIAAQIEIYFSLGFSLKHIDSHQHSHNNLSIMKCLIPFLKGNFDSIRLVRNIPFTEIGGIKKIYKNFINFKLMKINKSKKVRLFGRMIDVDVLLLEKYEYTGIEVETHPAFIGNKLVDLYNNESIEVWLKKYNM